jgi:coenzyme Q-binding protein COQ10
VGMSEPDKITGEGGVGSEVEITVLLAGVHLHETVRSLEDRRDPDGSAHWRAAITGPSSGWMTWDYKPENGGTLVTEEWEYTVPGSVLGKVADRLIFEKMQERDTRHSLENLKLLMEAGR